MNPTILPLTSLFVNKEARIARLEGGHGLQHKMQVMGIREGELIKVISKQPLRGPVTVEVNDSQITLGRGMAHKILVEIE